MQTLVCANASLRHGSVASLPAPLPKQKKSFGPSIGSANGAFERKQTAHATSSSDEHVCPECSKSFGNANHAARLYGRRTSLPKSRFLNSWKVVRWSRSFSGRATFWRHDFVESLFERPYLAVLAGSMKDAYIVDESPPLGV